MELDVLKFSNQHPIMIICFWISTEKEQQYILPGTGNFQLKEQVHFEIFFVSFFNFMEREADTLAVDEYQCALQQNERSFQKNAQVAKNTNISAEFDDCVFFFEMSLTGWMNCWGLLNKEDGRILPIANWFPKLLLTK